MVEENEEKEAEMSETKQLEPLTKREKIKLLREILRKVDLNDTILSEDQKKLIKKVAKTRKLKNEREIVEALYALEYKDEGIRWGLSLYEN